MRQNYYSIGKKHGIAFNDEAIESIQAELEKKVSTYICRLSKKIAPLEATMITLQSTPQRKESSIPEDTDEYDKILLARAEASRRKSDKMRQKAVADALQTHKIYMVSLESFVKKMERKSNWQYHCFLLGSARNRGVSAHPTQARFKSQVHLEYVGKLRKEINDNEN